MSKNPKSQKLCSASAELIGGNDDFLGQILPHLPVRSLTRFKSVSKQWCALISNPKFGRSHSLENPSPLIASGFYLYNPNNCMDDTVYSIPLSKIEGKFPLCSDPVELLDNIPSNLRRSLPQKNVMWMIHSCNGLSLFQFNTNLYSGMTAYCVRNLVTNQLKLVPSPNFDPNGERILTCCLAFDPLVSGHYKVICVKADLTISFTYKFMIFNTETGRWKDTDVTLSGFELECVRGEYFCGAIYWIVKCKRSCYRFDIEAENLKEISLPPTAYGSDIRHFGESNGHLYFVCVRDFKAKILNVYELDLVTMKWVIKHWVHINRLISSFPLVNGNGRNQISHFNHSILSVLRGENDEDTALVLYISDKVVSYNLKSKKVDVLLSEVRWKEQSRGVDCSFRPPVIPAYPFIASLYPLE